MNVVLIAVSSLDGCITRHDQPGAQGWASPDDQQHFRASTAACDVRVFGSGTYEPDREMFLRNTRPGVRRIVMTSRPERFVNDSVAGQLEFTAESPSRLVDRLRAEGHKRCALLGGGRLYGAFLRDNLVDELELTVEPVVFGSGVRLAGEEPIETRFALADIQNLNDSTILLRYRRAAPAS